MSSESQLSTGQKRMSKAIEWMKLISITGIVQILVTGLGMVSGFLVVRYLDTTQLALYSMANNILGTMVILADGGISNGVMAFGAQVHENSKKFGKVLNTGMDLRKKFAIISLIISSPILIVLLMNNGSSFMVSFVVLVSIIPTFLASLSGNLLEIVARIKQDIVPLQRIRMEFNIGRLVLIFIVVFLFPYAYLALLAAGLPQIYNSWRLRKLAAKYVDFSAEPDRSKFSFKSLFSKDHVNKEPVNDHPDISDEILVNSNSNEIQTENYKEKILRVVSRIMPGAAYFSISGQINLYLISIFSESGKANQSIAEIAGLDKLGMVMIIVSQLFVTLIVPRFAKLPDIKAALTNRFLQIFALLAVMSLFTIGAFYVFDTFLLSVLGDKYIGLEHYLLLNIIGNSLGMMAGNVYSLFVNRGWNIAPYFSIPLNIAIITVAVILFKIGTVEGVLKMNIFINSINLVVNTSYMIYKINSKRR
jgi:O-antigen/teichoic acid export membrane protein